MKLSDRFPALAAAVGVAALFTLSAGAAVSQDRPAVAQESQDPLLRRPLDERQAAPSPGEEQDAAPGQSRDPALSQPDERPTDTTAGQERPGPGDSAGAAGQTGTERTGADRAGETDETRPDREQQAQEKTPEELFLDGKAAYDRQDYRAALEILQPLAESGHIMSQYWVGQIYFLGFGGVEKNDAEAARWYSRAADGGLIVAISKLADMYARGDGVSRNVERAAALYRQAAERGDVESMVLVGRFYDEGVVYEKDQGKARIWYRRAAQLGSLDGMRRLAVNLMSTDQIPRDYRRAYTWLIIADEMGDREAGRMREALRRRFYQEEISRAEQWARAYLARGRMPPRLEFDN